MNNEQLFEKFNSFLYTDEVIHKNRKLCIEMMNYFNIDEVWFIDQENYDGEYLYYDSNGDDFFDEDKIVLCLMSDGSMAECNLIKARKAGSTIRWEVENPNYRGYTCGNKTTIERNAELIYGSENYALELLHDKLMQMYYDSKK